MTYQHQEVDRDERNREAASAATATTAVKADGGKPPMGLLPWPALWDIAEVLRFGAEKYTREISFNSSSMLSYLRGELEEWQKRGSAVRVAKLRLYQLEDSVLNAIQPLDQSVNTVIVEGRSTLENVVEAVMTSGLKRTTPSFAEVKEKTHDYGTPKTNIERKSIKSGEELTQNLESETKQLSERSYYETEVLPKRRLHYYYNSSKETAHFATEALQNGQYILIMTMRLDSHEDIFVVSATTALGSLTTAFKILKKQYPIFETAQLLDWSEEIAKIKISGRHNWKKGMQWSRMYDAMLRHLTAWIEGENKDPESGLPHLAHCGCCLLFLATYEKMGWGVDDRWKGNNG